MPHSLPNFGDRKFSHSGLLLSSEKRGWRGIAAELRRHSRRSIAPVPPTQMEVTLAVRGSNTSVVHRRAGQTQSNVAETGTIWFCPIGVQEDEISISDAIPEVLHVYLPKDQFVALAEKDGLLAASSTSIDYLAGIHDALIQQIGLRLLSELTAETAGGCLLAEALGQALAMHILSTYASLAKPVFEAKDRKRGLDQRRLARVTDYIAANIEGDVSVGALAEVACLSRHHFTRAFQTSTGLAPHRYVSCLRLENAKRLLRESDVPIAHIALACQFSSQSAFGRAFLRSVGASPADYRRAHR